MGYTSTKLIGLSNTLVKLRPSKDNNKFDEWKPTSNVDFITTYNNPNATTRLIDVDVRIPTTPKANDWFTAIHWKAGKNSLIKNVVTNPASSAEPQTNPKAHIKYSGNGGGRWFGAGSKGVPPGNPPYANVGYRNFLIQGTSQPLLLYNFNIEDGGGCYRHGSATSCPDNAWQAEISNSSNVVIYGTKFENFQNMKIQNSNNIAFFGSATGSEIGVFDSNNIAVVNVTTNLHQEFSAKVKDGNFLKTILKGSHLAYYKKGTVNWNAIKTGFLIPTINFTPIPTLTSSSIATPTLTTTPTSTPTPLLTVTPTPISGSLTPIFNGNPTTSNPLMIRESFQDFVFKSMGGPNNLLYEYGPSNTAKRWRNTGNNNFQLVSSFTDAGRTILPREGDKAIRWIVDANNTGPSTNPANIQAEWRSRSEIAVMDGAQEGFRHAQYGQEYWYGVSIFIPTNYAPDSVGEIHFQLHPGADEGEGSLNPSLTLRTSENNYFLSIKGDDRAIIDNNDPNFDYQRAEQFDLGAISKGVWTDWAINVKWSYKNTTNSSDPDIGFVRVYKNRQPATTPAILWGANSYNNTNGPYVKLGIYKPSWKLADKRQESADNGVTQRIVFHDSLRMTKRLPGEAIMSMNGLNRVSPQ